MLPSKGFARTSENGMIVFEREAMVPIRDSYYTHTNLSFDALCKLFLFILTVTLESNINCRDSEFHFGLKVNLREKLYSREHKQEC